MKNIISPTVSYIEDSTYSISSDIASNSDVEALKKEIEILKRKTNPEYAKECVKKELLEKYNKLVLSDIWWEACEVWMKIVVQKTIDSYDNEFKKIMNGGLSLISGASFSTTNGRFIGSSVTHPNKLSIIPCTYFKDNDIKFKTISNEISINDLLNLYPEIEGYEMEKFIVEYCETK